ncbi:unnamed protein product [Albugo candida]|uniref:Uncharacterized protein n=1 Tax=Albugo candida TaxID=65357 RepID=A0A024FTG0_9STRA|nr:unnamed protein product [Albugo candida]|eukprot:CCI10390.1 unnamed protein product [Albugo candida]
MFDQSNDFISYRCKFAEGQFQASESTKTEQEGFKAIITSLREISRRTPKLVLGPGAYNGVCIGTQWFFNGNDLTLSADTAPRFKHVMRIDADTTSGNSWQIKNLVVKWRGKTLDGNIVFNAAIKKIIVPVSFRSQCLKCHKDGGTTTIEFIYKETTTEYGQDVQVEKQFPITVKSEDLACMEGSKEHTIAIGLPKSEDLQPAATQKSGMLTRARPVDDGVYENPDLRAEQENNFDGGNQFFAGGSSSQATYAPHDFAGQGALQNEPSSSDLLLPREGLQPQWDTTSIQHQEGGSYDYNYLYPTSLQQQSNVPQWDLPHYGLP